MMAVQKRTVETVIGCGILFVCMVASLMPFEQFWNLLTNVLGFVIFCVLLSAPIFGLGRSCWLACRRWRRRHPRLPDGLLRARDNSRL